MSIIIPANSAAGGAGYQVDNSCRFNSGSSDSLSRSSTAGNKKTWTFSFWLKRSKLDVLQFIAFSDVANYFRMRITSGNVFEIFDSNGNNTWNWSNLLRDTSAWYHLVLRADSTDGTNGNRLRLYINGTLASANTVASISQGYDFSFNQGGTFKIAEFSGNNYLDGYLAETILIDGQALAPTDFGEFDEDSGIWKPIDVSGLTFGTNGFYLDFENSGALGADVSGNTNNFTVNNLTAIDQTTDTPTNNFATWNPLVKTSSTVTISEGNTIGTEATNGYYYGIVTTMFPTSGKWYGEMKFTSLGTVQTGFITEGTFIDGDRNLYSSSSSLYWQSGSTSISTVLNSSGVTTVVSGGSNSTSAFNSTNDIIMYAWDVDNGRAWFGINGTWQNSGNPAGPTNWWSLPSDYAAGVSLFTTLCGCGVGTATVNLNTGNPPFTGTDKTDGNSRGSFEYQPPDGFLSLCTANLSEFG